MSGGLNYVDRWNRGDAIETFAPHERQRLREDMRSQAEGARPNSPERARLMEDLSALYAVDYPTAPEPELVLVNGRFVDLNRGQR